MDPFRVYLKAKINEGQLDEFLTIVPQYIEAMEESEQQALQFEAFCNSGNREIVWLESFENAEGMDEHLLNNRLQHLRSKMRPFRESNVDMYFMSDPTDDTLEAFTERGFQPVVLTPWPGTVRLNESNGSKNRIQSLVKVELTDLERYRRISEKVESVAITQPGVSFHRSYQCDHSSIIAYEEYADEQAVIDWVEVFSQHSGDFASLVKTIHYQVFGIPTGTCKEILDSWGAVYFEKIAGFTRFN